MDLTRVAVDRCGQWVPPAADRASVAGGLFRYAPHCGFLITDDRKSGVVSQNTYVPEKANNINLANPNLTLTLDLTLT